MNDPLQVLASVISDIKFRLAFDVNTIAAAVEALQSLATDRAELEAFRAEEKGDGEDGNQI
tara:strand:+ start:9166 stop:9348 length:183 start_codon:yes stop_codon:yes gene_type:complete